MERKTTAELSSLLNHKSAFWAFVYFATGLNMVLGVVHPLLPVALLTWCTCFTAHRFASLELRLRQLEDRLDERAP